jgi:polysaccharide deacetylase 2 family uncharacterized protein YibQ
MVTDELHKPLEVRPRLATSRFSSATIGASLAGIVVAASLGFVALKGDPLGGEPHAIVRIDRTVKNAVVAAAPQDAGKVEAPAGGRETAQQMEDAAGVRVIRGKGGQVPGAVVITVPDDVKDTRLASLDRRLTERGRHGPLPKIDPQAGAPRDVYARPFDVNKAGKPLIAIVVTGLGIGAGATSDAITKLPGEVTFAFAPYGSDLEKTTARARDAGHELLLQAPMEPYGYPENDTGPHTLLAEGAEAQNLDRLHWLMSRFQGYVGITNFMGAKFTSVRPALKPVLDETARRGLLFVEDGSSARSLVPEVAGTAKLPNARGDVVLDGLDKPADFDAALARAESQARVKGTTIVFGPALPATIERLNRWARSLEGKGFMLAPVTAVVSRRS